MATTKVQYDLGQGWLMDLYTQTANGKETIIFAKNDQEEIALEDISVKRLREIFKAAKVA